MQAGITSGRDRKQTTQAVKVCQEMEESAISSKQILGWLAFVDRNDTVLDPDKSQLLPQKIGP